MINGLVDFSWWQYLVTFLILTQMTALSVSIYLHRSQAHRALDIHPALAHFFRFWLWLTTGMITKEWVAVHRKHHAKCETEEDPHSPQIVGLKKVFFGGYWLYRKEADKDGTLAEYGHQTPDDWIERNLYTPRNGWGILLLLALNVLLFGWVGLVMWVVQMIWIPLWAAGVINGVGHYWGYRNFECPDASTNVSPIGIIMGGEELHNNHHTYPTSAKFSLKWWEFDLSWSLICLFKALGLAKVKRIPPALQRRETKEGVDAETLKAVLVNRFQVLSQYSREVLSPVFKQEQSKARALGKSLRSSIKKLVMREQSLLDSASKMHLSEALRQSDHLKVAYDFRLRLQEIWTQAKADQKEHVEALKNWCEQAEASGIEALQRFARRVQSFAVSATTEAAPVKVK